MGKYKIEIGKEYRVIPTPCGLATSNWNNIEVNSGIKYIVKIVGPYGSISCDNRYSVAEISKDGCCSTNTGGWVYDYELAPLVYSIDEIKEQIVNLKSNIADKYTEVNLLEDKLAFMTEHGVENFNEEEFKAYQVLKELGIDDFEKAKRITQILSNKIGC